MLKRTYGAHWSLAIDEAGLRAGDVGSDAISPHRRGYEGRPDFSGF
jgi:hypothetical protein